MDRLTKRNYGPLPVLVRGHAHGPAYFMSQCDYEDYRDALNRLADYEDTGMTPEELDDFARQFSKIRQIVGCKTLEDFCNLADEGRLIVLPPKEGEKTNYGTRMDGGVNDGRT